jgi:hypothetical protein
VRNELQTRQKIKLSVHQLLLLIFFSLVFGALGFLYSFIGFFDHQRENINSLDLFNELTIQEIGGHFLFGFIVSIPLKNVKISILTGLMALTIDSDHLLNATGFDIQGRMDHSISFAILSSILMSIITAKIHYKVTNSNHIVLSSSVSILEPAITISNNDQNKENRSKRKKTVYRKLIQDYVFSLFFFITLAAFISHIAYDVLVDDKPTFPLLAPFSYSQIFIPETYGLPIEVAAFVLLLVINRYHLYYSNSNKPYT